MFRLKLTLGHDYPAAPPKGPFVGCPLVQNTCATPTSPSLARLAGTFLTRIFHPNVSASGDICVNTLKRDWTPDTTLAHVLAVVRCLLIVPFPESSLNDDAGKLFMESYDEYARKARLWTSIHAIPAAAGGAGHAPAAAAAAPPAAAGAVGDATPADGEAAPAPPPSAAGDKAAETVPESGAAAAAAPAAAAAAPQAFRTAKGNGAPVGGGASSAPAGSKRPASEGGAGTAAAPAAADRARKDAAAKRRL